MGLGLTLFGSIFAGIGIGVGYFAGLKRILEQSSSDDGIGRIIFETIFSGIPFLMGIVFFLIGLLIFGLGLQSLFGTIYLEFGRNRALKKVSRILFLRNTRILDLSMISNLHRKKNASQEGGTAKPSITYGLRVKYQGKNVSIADGLKGTQLCDAVEKKIRAAIEKAGGEV